MFRTFLLIDLHAHVDVNADDDQVADDVECSHAIKDVGIIERYLLARLHHHQDDDQIGASKRHSISLSFAVAWATRHERLTFVDSSWRLEELRNFQRGSQR